MSALRTQLGPSRPGASSRRGRTSARTPAMRCTPWTRGRNRASGTLPGSPPNGPPPRWTARVPTRRCAWSGSPCAEKIWPAGSPWCARPAILLPGKLARALTEFIAPGVPRSIDQGMQLKVTLKHTKPAIWRSVRLPVIATLADLHWVIQLLFGWDGDHLHAFRVGRRAYSDPFFALEDAADEDDIRVRAACR